MIIYITTEGDRSVGIEPDIIELTWNVDMGMLSSSRENIRNDLKEFFTEFLDSGIASVRFEDEPEVE